MTGQEQLFDGRGAVDFLSPNQVLTHAARAAANVIQPVVRSFASLTKGASKMLRATGHARMVTANAKQLNKAPLVAARGAREGLWLECKIFCLKLRRCGPFSQRFSQRFS